MLIEQRTLDGLRGRTDEETLELVHAWASQHFNYTTDEEARGQDEYWSSAEEIKADLDEHHVLVDDCDGFALMCRELLDLLEVPNRLVLCVVPEREGGGGHLVCESNGFVLDNRYEKVYHYKDGNYRWVMISGYKAGEPWREIKNK